MESTVLHWAAIRTNECWRSQQDDANLMPPITIPSMPWLHLEILSIEVIRIIDKGILNGVQPSVEISQTYCCECGPRSETGCTGTEHPVSGDLVPHTPKAPLRNSARDMVECLLQIHKTHVDHLNGLPCTPEGAELVHWSTVPRPGQNSP